MSHFGAPLNMTHIISVPIVPRMERAGGGKQLLSATNLIMREITDTQTQPKSLC